MRKYLEFIKWIGTITAIVSVAFASFNIYPWNIIFSIISCVCWGYGGWCAKDRALIVVEIAMLGVSFAGLVSYLISIV